MSSIFSSTALWRSFFGPYSAVGGISLSFFLLIGLLSSTRGPDTLIVEQGRSHFGGLVRLPNKGSFPSALTVTAPSLICCSLLLRSSTVCPESEQELGKLGDSTLHAVDEVGLLIVPEFWYTGDFSVEHTYRCDGGSPFCSDGNTNVAGRENWNLGE
ncbi:hypothetical protein Ancab_012451 [Ancistrocladus abbreviatus]